MYCLRSLDNAFDGVVVKMVKVIVEIPSGIHGFVLYLGDGYELLCICQNVDRDTLRRHSMPIANTGLYSFVGIRDNDSLRGRPIFSALHTRRSIIPVSHSNGDSEERCLHKPTSFRLY